MGKKSIKKTKKIPEAEITCHAFGGGTFKGPNGEYSFNLKELAARLTLPGHTVEVVCKEWTKECGAYVDPTIIGAIIDQNPRAKAEAAREMRYLNELTDKRPTTEADILKLQQKHRVDIASQLLDLTGQGEPKEPWRTYNAPGTYAVGHFFDGSELPTGTTTFHEVEQVKIKGTK